MFLEKYFYSQDGLGSVRTVSDLQGQLLNTYDYHAFGEEYAGGTVQKVHQRYGYTGREMSALSGASMYYRYRTYLPSMGRFAQRDPIGYRGSGVNLYGYAAAHVSTKIDPFGLFVVTGDSFNDAYARTLEVNAAAYYTLSNEVSDQQAGCTCENKMWTCWQAANIHGIVEPEALSLPNWVNYNQASPADKLLWDAIYAYIAAHEVGHIAAAMTVTSFFGTKLITATSGQFKNRLDAETDAATKWTNLADSWLDSLSAADDLAQDAWDAATGIGYL